MRSKPSRIVRFPIEVTPRAVEIWTQMWKLEQACTCADVPHERRGLCYRCNSCERWSKLDHELSLELHCRPWEAPCTIHPDDDTVPDNRWSRIMKSRCNALDAAQQRSGSGGSQGRRPRRYSCHLVRIAEYHPGSPPVRPRGPLTQRASQSR
jgi:hypothetical protein